MSRDEGGYFTFLPNPVSEIHRTRFGYLAEFVETTTFREKNERIVADKRKLVVC